MTLANIKTQLAAVLDGITNIDTDHVFIDEPDTMPTAEQMPCLVVTLPRITPSMPVNGLTQCVYHFEIKYLYAPLQLAEPQAATTAIDGYLKAVWDALFGALTLSSNATSQDFDGDTTRPTVVFRNEIYWGLNIPWRVTEQVTTTVTC
jgi:hypothetical protein